MTSRANQTHPQNTHALIKQLHKVVETNRSKLQQIVVETKYGEWDKEDAVAEAKKLATQTLQAAQLLKQILELHS